MPEPCRFRFSPTHASASASCSASCAASAHARTLPGARGVTATRVEIVLYSLVQLLVSLMLFSLGVSGALYLAVAAAAGFAYLGYAASGLFAGDARWARRLFLASIVYLPVVVGAMVVDGRM